MLNVWRHFRVQATALLVVTYALAVLLPSLAFSFDRDVSIVHSLVEAHGGLTIPHFHHDDTDHHADHEGHGPTGGAAHHCCGALSLAGLLLPVAFSTVDRVCTSLISPAPQEQHPGCGPVRLDRPPRLFALI